MPRHADVDQQRDLLARAVWRLVTRGGLEAVSLRSVAAEAGVSMGRVQHYFATKDALLVHGLEHAHQRMQARIEQRVAATAGNDRDVLWAVLDEMLGEHPETREAIRISSAYAVRALEDARIAAVLTDGDADILALATSVVEQVQPSRPGAEANSYDPTEEAKGLWALACGLGADVALYGASPTAARATLSYHFRRAVPPTNQC